MSRGAGAGRKEGGGTGEGGNGRRHRRWLLTRSSRAWSLWLVLALLATAARAYQPTILRMDRSSLHITTEQRSAAQLARHFDVVYGGKSDDVVHGDGPPVSLSLLSVAGLASGGIFTIRNSGRARAFDDNAGTDTDRARLLLKAIPIDVMRPLHEGPREWWTPPANAVDDTSTTTTTPYLRSWLIDEVRISARMSNIEDTPFVRVREAFGGNFRKMLQRCDESCAEMRRAPLAEHELFARGMIEGGGDSSGDSGGDDEYDNGVVDTESSMSFASSTNSASTDNIIIDTNNDVIDTQFLILEYIPGPDLHQVLNDEVNIRNRIITPRFILSILIQTLAALDTAARLHGYHNLDVHPRNIMLDRRVDPLLCAQMQRREEWDDGLWKVLRRAKLGRWQMMSESAVDDVDGDAKEGTFRYRLANGEVISVPKSWSCGAQVRIIDHGLAVVLDRSAEHGEDAVDEDSDESDIEWTSKSPSSEDDSLPHIDYAAAISELTTSSARVLLISLFADTPCRVIHTWRISTFLTGPSRAYRTLQHMLRAAMPAGTPRHPIHLCRPLWYGSDSKAWTHGYKWARVEFWRSRVREVRRTGMDERVTFDDLLEVYRDTVDG